MNRPVSPRRILTASLALFTLLTAVGYTYNRSIQKNEQLYGSGVDDLSRAKLIWGQDQYVTLDGRLYFVNESSR